MPPAKPPRIGGGGSFGPPSGGDQGGGAIEQVGGVFKGFGKGLWGSFNAAVDLGQRAKQCAGPLNMLACAAQSADDVYRAASHPVDSTKSIYHALTDPAVNAWKRGDKGEAVGYTLAAIIEVVVGTKGATKLPKITGPAAKTATTSIDDLLRPDGTALGKAGTDESIRELTGGLTDARAMFGQLSHGGTIVAQTPKLTRVELPGGGSVQLRTVMSRSPNTVATIDVNIPGIDIRKLKYNP